MVIPKTFDKPMSMSVKDYLIRILAVRAKVPEKTIEAVVNHQFQTATEVMLKEEGYSVEISGFGKLFFNHKKALKKLDKAFSKKRMFEKMLAEEQSEQKRRSLQMKLDSTMETIMSLKPKLDELCPDLRGMEKQAFPGQPHEGTHSDSGQTENGDMQNLQSL